MDDPNTCLAPLTETVLGLKSHNSHDFFICFYRTKILHFITNSCNIKSKNYKGKIHRNYHTSHRFVFNNQTKEKKGLLIKAIQKLKWIGRVVRTCWENFQCQGVLLIWIIVGQGPIALVVGAGGELFGHFFSRLLFLFSFSPLGDGPI